MNAEKQIHPFHPYYVVIAFVVCIISALMLRGPDYGDLIFWMEAIFYGTVLFLFSRLSLVVSCLRAVSYLQRAFLVLFVMALIVGQMVADSASTYPAVTWAMYSKPIKQPPHFLECEGISVKGTDIPLPAARTFRGLGRRLTRTWVKLASAIENESDETLRSELWESFDNLVLSMVRVYDEEHPEVSLSGAKVWKVTVPLGKGVKREDYPKVLFRTITFPETKKQWSTKMPLLRN